MHFSLLKVLTLPPLYWRCFLFSIFSISGVLPKWQFLGIRCVACEKCTEQFHYMSQPNNDNENDNDNVSLTEWCRQVILFHSQIYYFFEPIALVHVIKLNIYLLHLHASQQQNVSTQVGADNGELNSCIAVKENSMACLHYSCTQTLTVIVIDSIVRTCSDITRCIFYRRHELFLGNGHLGRKDIPTIKKEEDISKTLVGVSKPWKVINIRITNFRLSRSDFISYMI